MRQTSRRISATKSKYSLRQYEVVLTLHKPYKYDAAISGRDGASWSAVLTAIRELRYEERADEDVYYYGSFMPTNRPYARRGARLSQT